MKALQYFVKDTHSHDRLCAVSDGVYAIALTLLVLDLKVPELSGTTNRELTTDLVQQLPNFLAYLIGFFVVAFFWMNHHRIFQSITCCDTRALALNFVQLFFISLTPYVVVRGGVRLSEVGVSEIRKLQVRAIGEPGAKAR